jgi:hypothetical protein
MGHVNGADAADTYLFGGSGAHALELALHQLGEGAMEAGDGASGKSVAVMVSRPGLVGADKER